MWAMPGWVGEFAGWPGRGVRGYVAVAQSGGPLLIV
jgi:hypothetical protein